MSQVLRISLPAGNILHKGRDTPPEGTIKMINLVDKLLSGRFQQLRVTLKLSCWFRTVTICLARFLYQERITVNTPQTESILKYGLIHRKSYKSSLLEVPYEAATTNHNWITCLISHLNQMINEFRAVC